MVLKKERPDQSPMKPLLMCFQKRHTGLPQVPCGLELHPTFKLQGWKHRQSQQEEDDDDEF